MPRLIRLPAAAIILLVRAYQYFLSPLLGHHCRYRPTCSQYMVRAVSKYGAICGTLRGIWRICRCHPLCRGGYDPP
jgi:hypothetical protein